MAADLAGFEQPAFGAHIGRHELFEHGARFRAACDDKRAALQDGDAGGFRHLQPDVARAHGALPAFAGLLPGYGDEAEIADRGAVGMRVAVGDDHALASRAAASACARPQMPAPTTATSNGPDEGLAGTVALFSSFVPSVFYGGRVMAS